MKAGLIFIALALLASLFVLGRREEMPLASSFPASVAANSTDTPVVAAEDDVDQGFLYGRVTTVDGLGYEGRLRWGIGEEAFWGDYFNGAKSENPWVAYTPLGRPPTERYPIEVFGIETAQREREVDLGRLFMARFGDITRIEAQGRGVRVTLKSGTVFELDRLEASDFDDGVRMWDNKAGVVDLDSMRIRSIELAPARGDVSLSRLHGTVRTRHGDFTGFVQWDREECLGSDELEGRAADGESNPRFDTIRAITRQSSESVLVTLLDGRELVLSGSRKVAEGNRGVYVDDPRYGRVLVSWDAFEHIDFSPGGGGPAYLDFPPGRPLTGGVTTRAGDRFVGRLVYDLDESETTETFDAPSQGVNYTIPFGLIASIVPPRSEDTVAGGARVTLHNGEQLQLESSGDLGEGNAGVLIFVDGKERPEYVLWADVARIDLDPPPVS